VKEILNMKTLTAALAILVVAVMTGNAQTSTTDPVGYNTITVAGNGGSGVKYSYLAVNLLNSAVFVGQIDGGLKAAAGSFTSGQFNQGTTYAKFYVEVMSGANAGSQADIVSNTTDTLTVVGNAEFQATIGSGASVSIRKHRTLADVFGGSSASATATDVLLAPGGTLSAADNVMLYEGGNYKSYYYSSNTLRAGWRDSGGILSTDRPIYQNQGVIIARKSNSDVVAVVVGVVKTGLSLIDLDAGYTLVSLPAPADATLPSIFGGISGSASATDVKIAKGGTLSAADNILVVSPTGSIDTYYYSSNTLRPGWRNSSGDVASSATISGSAAVFIKKAAATVLAVTQIPSSQ
jgi:uncharacterized protein (TIGR02597 family)